MHKDPEAVIRGCAEKAGITPGQALSCFEAIGLCAMDLPFIAARPEEISYVCAVAASLPAATTLFSCVPDHRESGPCPLCGGAPEFDGANLEEGDFELSAGRVRCRACGTICTNLVSTKDLHP